MPEFTRCTGVQATAAFGTSCHNVVRRLMARYTWQRAPAGRWTQAWLSGPKLAGLRRNVAPYVCFIAIAAVGISVLVQTFLVVRAYTADGDWSPYHSSGGGQRWRWRPHGAHTARCALPDALGLRLL